MFNEGKIALFDVQDAIVLIRLDDYEVPPHGSMSVVAFERFKEEVSGQMLVVALLLMV